MNELDKQIEYWKRIYLDTYAQGPRKFAKWKFVGGSYKSGNRTL